MHRKLIRILLIAAILLAIAIGVLLIWYASKGQPPAQTNPPTPAEATQPLEFALQAPTAPPVALAVPDASSSPEALVRYYLDRWNAKDTTGMDDCRVEADRGLYPYDDLPYEEEVVVHEVRELPELRGEFNSAWYPGAVDVALVEARFSIRLNESGRENLLTESIEHDGYRFWLVREVQGGPWRIAIQGY